MPVVRLRQPLTGLCGDCSLHRIHGGTVGECLRRLEVAHPPVSGWMLDERGSLRRHINVFVNGERGTAETAVADDDRVDVLPAITGG